MANLDHYQSLWDQMVVEINTQNDPESTKPSRTEGRRVSRLVAPWWEPHPLARPPCPVGRLAWASAHFLMLPEA